MHRKPSSRSLKNYAMSSHREETAINIAVACQLLWTEAKMHRTVINLRGTGESETDEIKQALEGKQSLTTAANAFGQTKNTRFCVLSVSDVDMNLSFLPRMWEFVNASTLYHKKNEKVLFSCEVDQNRFLIKT